MVKVDSNLEAKNIDSSALVAAKNEMTRKRSCGEIFAKDTGTFVRLAGKSMGNRLAGRKKGQTTVAAKPFRVPAKNQGCNLLQK